VKTPAKWRVYGTNTINRSGPFRYEELPLEIRQKIIESLIRPFFHFSEDTNTYWLDLSVEYYCHDIDNPVEDERLPLYERPKVKRRIENPLSYNSYEKATSCRNLTSKLTIVSRDAGDILTGEPYYQTLYSRDERSVRPKVHPYRIGPYNLVASPAHFGQTMVETIRDLSQVSKMFRRDLGSIFWRRVHLSTLSHKHNLLALGPLLIDRPALMARLMCLEIEIDFAWFWKKPQKEEEFAQLCDILESGAQLERFFVRIMFHGETTMYNLSSVGYSCFLQHVRKVNVTGEFELGIRYLGIEGRLPDKDKRRPKKQHLAAIEKLIMPDTIRARQSTAVLDYMVSRLNHCNINDSSGSIHYPRGGTSRVS